MTTPQTPSRLPGWAPFVVLMVAFVAQAGVLGGGWLLDDAGVIQADADIARGPAGIPRVFARGRLGGDHERGAYRPLMLATFALEAPLWTDGNGDLEPFGFHLTNLLLHGVAAILLLLLLARIAPSRPWVSIGAALMFAAHPMNTGTIASLLGRADLLALIFGLAAARLWVRREGLGVAELAWVGLFTFLALMSKEVALALPFVFVALDLAAGRGMRGIRARWRGYAALMVAVGVYLVLWPGVAEGQPDLPQQSPAVAVALGAAGVLRMALRFLLPVGYRGDHTDEAIGSEGFALEGATALAAGAGVALALLALFVLLAGRRAPVALVWLIVFGTSLIAALTQPVGRTLELRFAYFAGAALFVLAGLVVETLVHASSRAGIARTAGWAGAALLLLGLGGLSHAEAKAWHDDEAYHDRLLHESPGHVRALVRQARLQRRLALSLQARASTLPVTDEGGRPNPEVHRLRKRRAAALDSAAGWLRRVMNRVEGRRLPGAWAELGFVRLARGEPAEALRAFDEAKRLDPVLNRAEGVTLDRFNERQLSALAEIYFSEGTCRKALGDAERSSSAFQSAIRLDPANSAYLREAGLALMKQFRWGEGLPLIQKAMRNATSAQERDELESLYRQQEQRAREFAARSYQAAEGELAAGNREGALPRYEDVIRADPDHIDARIRAARIVGSYFGNYARANEYLLQARRIAQARTPPDTAKLEEIQKWARFLAKRKQQDDLGMEAPRPPEGNGKDDEGDK